MNFDRTTQIKPLLRWAGGKQWIVERIKEFIPSEYNQYYEPFLGGASIYLSLICSGKKTYLSDLNYELINFYLQVKDNLQLLLLELKNYKNDEQFFYKTREDEKEDTLRQAARFFYLNRTCFNGLYRVNQKGKFNVPYGHRKIDIIDENKFIELNIKLQNATIRCQDFNKIIKTVKEKDFVFLDPPYTVAHNKNGFIEYNQKIFSWEDQERLAKFVNELIDKNVYFLMTNACHDSIKKLYRDVGNQYEIDRYSTISALNKSRTRISELIITNCL